MNEIQLRENLFVLIKRALKAKGFTYAKLADAMGISELSIKRLFKDKDCKMSRLLELCQVIGLSFDDLLNMQQRNNPAPEYLPYDVEQAMAEDKHLFVLFVLLISHLDTRFIQQCWNLEDHQIYLELRKLESLGLITLRENNRVDFNVSLPIRWRVDGPLSPLIKAANQRYIAYSIDHEGEPEHGFTTTSRLMTKASAEHIQEQLRQVRREFDYVATQDQMFYENDELHLYKFIFAMGPFPVEEMFPYPSE